VAIGRRVSIRMVGCSGLAAFGWGGPSGLVHCARRKTYLCHSLASGMHVIGT
jgi:hypothetical protein